MWILAKSEAIQVRPPFVKISLMIGVRTYFFTFTFALYREKKLSEGKSAAVARSHVAKKLVRIIHSFMTHSTAFSDQLTA